MKEKIKAIIVGSLFLIPATLFFWAYWESKTEPDAGFTLVFSLVFFAISLLVIFYTQVKQIGKKHKITNFFIKMFENHEKQQKLSPKEMEELRAVKEEEKMIKREKRRTKIEKYMVSEIGGWGLWLLIPSLIGGGYLAIDYFSNENINWYVLFFSALAMGSMITPFDLDDKWKKILQYKAKISEREENYQFSPNKYLYGYFYTDSALEFYAYKLAKIATYLITITMFVAIAILLFMWLGSISIAPTTIIIILLIIIIIQNANKHRSD